MPYLTATVSWAKPSLEECRGRVKADFEQAMGITDLLKEQPNQESLNKIEAVRQKLDSVIEERALFLYREYHK